MKKGKRENAGGDIADEGSSPGDGIAETKPTKNLRVGTNPSRQSVLGHPEEIKEKQKRKNQPTNHGPRHELTNEQGTPETLRTRSSTSLKPW